MANPSLVGLINNLALLFVMGALYGRLYPRSATGRGKLFCGFALGILGVGVMMTPWELAPGIFFDTRAIVLSVGGLFLGLIPTSIAMVMTALYRVYAGGAGTLTGVLWVVVAGLIGVAWGGWRKKPAASLSGWEYYLFGFFVQVCMLALLLTMPSQYVAPILSQISLPVMAFFPFGSFWLAKMLAEQERREKDKLALDQSERKYRELVQHSQACILRVDRDGRCTFVNDYVQKLFGFSETEMLGHHLFETIVPKVDADGNTVLADLPEILDRPHRFPVKENENICRDGRRLIVQWKNTPLYNEQGEIVGVQSVGHDVTEQRAAEKKLQAAERQLQSLVEISPVSLAFLQHPDKIVYINRRFSEVLGYQLNDIPDLSAWWLRAYPDPVYREMVQNDWNDAFTRVAAGNGEFAPREFRVTCKDGTVKDILFHVSVMGDQNVVAIHDMTGEREIDRMKREFIATAAHELNTPLTTIFGFSEILLEQNHLPAEQKEYLAIIHEKAQALERIVDDLLDVGRIEAGRSVQLECSECRIQDTISAAVDCFRKEFPDWQFLLNWEAADDLTLSVDGARLCQVMDNLLSNAVKYSSTKRQIRVQAMVDGDLFRLEVEDNGIGMTTEQLERIFERFYRVDLSNTAVSGLGLGMSIAKSIVEAHGGTIKVESELGAWTRVTFTLPLASA